MRAQALTPNRSKPLQREALTPKRFRARTRTVALLCF